MCVGVNQPGWLTGKDRLWGGLHPPTPAESTSSDNSDAFQSYQNLAAAAADLAKDAVQSGPARAAAPAPAPAATPPPPGARSTFLPFQQSGTSGGGAGPPKPPTPAGSSGRRALVSTPKFPPYNPLVHVLTSDLPMPGTPSALQMQQQRGGSRGGMPGGALGARPSTSNPITHEMDFPAIGVGYPQAATLRPGSTAIGGVASCSPWREEPLPMLGTGREQLSWAGPGDIGSEKAQVLFVEPGNTSNGR